MTEPLAPVHVPNKDDEDRPPAAPERAPTLFWWAAATAFGLFVNNLYFQLLLAARLNAALTGPPPNSASLALLLVLIPEGVSQGAIVSGAQWFLLRRYLKNIQWWIVASIVGWTAFYLLDFGYLALAPRAPSVPQAVDSLGALGGLLFFSLLQGLAIGLFQWLVLRRWGQLALVWIPIVIAAQLVNVLVAQLLSALPVAPILGWIANGLMLGSGMALLLYTCWPSLLKQDLAVTAG